jgi:hypothetical protein
MKLPRPFQFPAALALFIAATGASIASEATVLAQDLLKVSASDKVVAALWTRRPDSYTLQVVLERSRPVAKATPVSPPTASNEAEYRSGTGSFFIGNTIANLRCLDPDFGDRTLTLVDGRRAVAGQSVAPPAPQQPRAAPPPRPLLSAPPQVQVWLLRADGTQILPVVQAPNPALAEPVCRTGVNTNEVLFRFALADSGQAVAAAIKIDDEYYIEKLQPLVTETAQ